MKIILILVSAILLNAECILKEYSDGPAKVCKNKQGLLDGLQTAWQSDGSIMYKINYKKGKQHGSYLWNYESGALKSLLNYKNGKKNGNQKEYNEYSFLIEDFNFIDGIQHGIQTLYDENGNLFSIEQYDNGVAFGKMKYYDENGKINQTIEYNKNGIKQGFERRYNSENGVKTKETYYVNGLKLGKEISYDMGSGEVFSVTTYKNNLPIKILVKDWNTGKYILYNKQMLENRICFTLSHNIRDIYIKDNNRLNKCQKKSAIEYKTNLLQNYFKRCNVNEKIIKKRLKSWNSYKRNLEFKSLDFKKDCQLDISSLIYQKRSRNIK